MAHPFRNPASLAPPLSHANQRRAGRLRRARHLFRRGRSFWLLAPSLALAVLTVCIRQAHGPREGILACCIAQGLLLFVAPFLLGVWRLRRAWQAHTVAAAHERLRRELPAGAKALLESDSMVDQDVGFGMLREWLGSLNELQQRVMRRLVVEAIHLVPPEKRRAPRLNLLRDRRSKS